MNYYNVAFVFIFRIKSFPVDRDAWTDGESRQIPGKLRQSCHQTDERQENLPRRRGVT